MFVGLVESGSRPVRLPEGRRLPTVPSHVSGVARQEDSLGGVEDLLPPVTVRGVGVLPAEVLRHLPGGELSLADVAEVPGQVDGLPLHQGSQQGHVTRLPPPGRKAQT